ncbi:TetR/AcrR family transcriptional regulator [Actinomadura sp. ATCC 31491]|uniref:TetR/AcrR family transcriptional regulator n=1 Tax=Actinomadura luzonensis TaxID=2805427 RepID=A0ABT0FLP4_9ACTN|nr:TetR/AcrR family transcriptional regulator [Actinomadura luzonensis]MCK2213259.1 TetR/AcrR family transcriptional regulator [Actinomadura luzonensis]
MTEATGRRRAPAMTPEQRREMIVRAALPLVVEYGTSVTTAQVARAAGIGEGTVFRAFGDKDALLAACMAEALRPDDTLAHIASISLELPLAERLIEAAEALRGYLARMGAVAGAMAASGGLRRGDPTAPAAAEGESREDRLRRGADAREASLTAHREALAGLFDPERDTLRLPPERLAQAFQMLVMAGGRHPDPMSSAELVDLFLHGALTTG